MAWGCAARLRGTRECQHGDIQLVQAAAQGGGHKLKMRKGVPTDEPRPAKVGVLFVCVKHMSVFVGGRCRSLSSRGSRINGMGLCSTPAGCA